MTTVAAQLPAMTVAMRLDTPTAGWPVRCLRTADGRVVAQVPVAVQLNPLQAGRLLQAWLAEGQVIHWQRTTRILAEEGAAA